MRWSPHELVTVAQRPMITLPCPFHCTVAHTCFFSGRLSLCPSYGVMKVPIPKTPAKKVLVVLRGDPPARRAIVNAKEMLAVMDNYGIEYT